MRYLLMVPVVGLAALVAVTQFAPSWAPQSATAAVAQGREQVQAIVNSVTAPRSAQQVQVEPAGRIRVVAEGRVVTYPGGQVSVASEVVGTIRSIRVEERQRVRKGQVIAQLSSDEQEAALAESRSKLAEIEADIALADWKISRVKDMSKTGAASATELQEATRNLESGKARRAACEATIRRMEAVIAKLKIVSPIDGTVVSRRVNAGEAVSPGQTMVTVADLNRLRIEAEVDEFDIGRLANGAEATVTAEGYDSQSWKGHVEEIPDAVVERATKPQDPARPTDVRVLRVKVALGEKAPLKLGQRVMVQIDVPVNQAGTTARGAKAVAALNEP